MDGIAKSYDEIQTMDGSPSRVENQYIKLKFQAGPIKENGVNGTTIEEVTNILIRRLEGFQNGPFKCRENALAITKLEEAIHWLNHRTKKRVAQGVEGVNQPHV